MVSKLDILLINYEYPPNGGGGGMFTKSLRDGLDDLGHDVRVISRSRTDAESTASTSDLLTFPFKSLPKVVRMLRNEDIDVIDGHFAVPSSVFLPPIAKVTETPLVVTAIGADIYDPTRYSRIRPLLDQLNYRYILKYADAVVVSSTDMCDRLPEWIRPKTSIIPYNVDQDRFTPISHDQSDDGISILTVCRLVERKNLETAIDAIKLIRDDGHDVTYTIVGEGPLREKLEEYATAMGLEETVTFEGYVPNDQLPDLYPEYDAFFLPSYHEGFGIVYLEAMSCGVPVVASNNGGQTDIITEDVGFTADPTDSRAHADNLIKAATCKRMGWNARDRIKKNYTKRQTAEMYADVYNSVIK